MVNNMSSGIFVQTFYETDDGDICNCRVQEETILATFGGVANTPVAGPADQLASANITSDRSGNGVFARYVRVFFATPPTGYASSILNIPVLTNAAYDAATLGAAVEYLGASGVIRTRNKEEIG